jgi:hypothetical protein
MITLPQRRVIFEHFDEDGVLERTTEHRATVYMNSKRAYINYLGGTRNVRPQPSGEFRTFGSKRIRQTSFAAFRERIAATAKQVGIES